MPEKSKSVFTTRGPDENGEKADLKLYVKLPGGQVRTKAQLHRAKTYGEAVANKVMVKQELDHYLRNMKLWDDDKEESFQILRKKILDGEMQIAKGGIKKKQGAEIAKECRGARAMLNEILFPRRQIEQNTADAIADQAQFEYLVAACTFHAEGHLENKPYFASLENYLERAADEDGRAAAREFSDLFYGQVEDPFEEVFLKQYGFADAEGRLIDPKGRFIDGSGRLIDAEGYLINENNERIDVEGNRVDESGKYLVEFTPFLDDDDEVEPETDEGEDSE